MPNHTTVRIKNTPNASKQLLQEIARAHKLSLATFLKREFRIIIAEHQEYLLPAGH